jgi:hypothetical protein
MIDDIQYNYLHGAESFFRSHWSLSFSRISQYYGTLKFITVFTRALH